MLTDVVAAKTVVRGACKRQADTLFVGADRLDTLESLSGSDGRAVLPELLAATQLQLVYSPGFSTDTAIVACSFFAEFYEDVKGFTMLRPKQSNVVAPGTDVAGDPTTFGVFVSFSAYAATRIRAEATCGIPAS